MQEREREGGREGGRGMRCRGHHFFQVVPHDDGGALGVALGQPASVKTECSGVEGGRVGSLRVQLTTMKKVLSTGHFRS